MAEGKNSFVLYKDIIKVVSKLPRDKAGDLFMHILEYVNDMNPETDDIIIDIAFEPIKQSLKRDLKKWEKYIEKQKVNGAKGGRPKKEEQQPKKPKPFLGNPTEPKKADSVSVSVSDSVKEDIPPLPPNGEYQQNKIDFKKLTDHYHNKCPELPKIRVMSNARKRAVNARVKEHGKDAVAEMLDKAGKSPFLNGDNDRGWIADFDWLFKPTNFVKIIEGNYSATKKDLQQTYKPGDK